MNTFLEDGMKFIERDPFIAISQLKSCADELLAQKVVFYSQINNEPIEKLIEKLYDHNNKKYNLLYKYLVIPNAIQGENPLLLPIENNIKEFNTSLKNNFISIDYRCILPPHVKEENKRVQEWSKIINTDNILKEGYVVKAPQPSTLYYRVKNIINNNKNVIPIEHVNNLSKEEQCDTYFLKPQQSSKSKLLSA